MPRKRVATASAEGGSSGSPVWVLSPCMPLPFGDQGFVLDIGRAISPADGAQGLVAVAKPPGATAVTALRLSGHVPSGAGRPVRIRAVLRRLSASGTHVEVAQVDQAVAEGSSFDVTQPASFKLTGDQSLVLHLVADGQSRLYTYGVAFA